MVFEHADPCLGRRDLPLDACLELRRRIGDGAEHVFSIAEPLAVAMGNEMPEVIHGSGTPKEDLSTGLTCPDMLAVRVVCEDRRKELGK